MSWMNVGAMGVSVATKLLGGLGAASSQNIQALNNQAQGSRNETAAWDDNTAVNKSIADANLQNVIRTGYKVGLLNVQRAQAKKQAMQQGIDLSRRGLALTGQATANAAASGTIGSSVSAVLSDIEQRQDEAGAQLGDNYAQQEANFDVQLHDLLTAGADSQQSNQSVHVQETQKASLVSGKEVLTGALLGTASQAANSYLSSQMSLGTPAATGSTAASLRGGTNSAGGTLTAGDLMAPTQNTAALQSLDFLNGLKSG